MMKSQTVVTYSIVRWSKNDTKHLYEHEAEQNDSFHVTKRDVRVLVDGSAGKNARTVGDFL